MRLVGLLSTCLMLATSLYARIWSVPLEVSTIQAALDSCSAGDTVLVEPGVYNESLLAPAVPAVLSGSASPFSLNPVVIDPSPLPGSDSLVCLRVPIAPIRIDSILFRNGPLMFPRAPGVLSGGVVIGSSNVVLSHCFFDSVHAPIRSNQLVTVLSCELFSARSGCVASSGGLRAELSAFSGVGFALISADQTLILTSCSMSGASTQYLVSSTGSVDIRLCSFGPFPSGIFTRLFLTNAYGTISRNTFERFDNELHGIVHLGSACNDSLKFSDNTFRNITCRDYLVSLAESCELPIPVTFANNVFVSCDVSSAHAKALSIVEGNAIIERNHFGNLTGTPVGTVRIEQSATVMRQNIFINTGYAVQAGFLTDARQNFWGDSTGPYHPTLNPDGLGDRVSDSVLFDPWYPDTSFLIDAAEERVELPEQFQLSVFPNPFNSTARLMLFAPEPFIGSITLTNILGQLVREIHRGPLYGQETFLIAADALPSGIYLLSVRDVIRNTVNSTHKIALIR